MDLSLFYFAIGILVLLPTADQSEFNIDSCPTSRRLLFFGGFNFSLGEKKSEHASSSLKSPSTSSSAKHARTDHKHGAIIYIRPQTSAEMGRKIRSYSHLLKPKLFKDEEQSKLKKKQSPKKKTQIQKSIKKKNGTQQTTKTRDLVALNDEERERCRALLHIDQQEPVTPLTDAKESKKTKNKKTSKENDSATEKKKVPNSTKSSSVDDKQKTGKEKSSKEKPEKTKSSKEKPEKTKSSKEKPEKAKPEKTESKSNSNEKKRSTDKPTETVTPPIVTQAPKKSQSSPPTTPPPPPPVSPSSSSTKSKREKTPPTIDEPTVTFNTNDPMGINPNGKNNSVVDRAYHFVRNMFQLSDDILESNFTNEDDQTLSSVNDEQHHQSRKLLSIADEVTTLSDNDTNNWNFNELNDVQLIVSFHNSPLSYTSVLKRQLLSVKKTKQASVQETPAVKPKKTGSTLHKPKVGWAYRYRISRYLADQKFKRSGHAKKSIGGGKLQPPSVNKKTSSSANTKFSKRKLLGFNMNDELDLKTNDNNYIPNDGIVDTVAITQDFVPKRQLFNSKHTHAHEEETDNEDNSEKASERRRMKSYEEITDPVEIVRSYELGLFKPRVGWQFRYRVSRYIDALRDNIREDQERLKLGLEAIKRKTPQELSGRRKRVLDKPFASETKEEKVADEESKPHAGWRYRYRISKMLEAKARGEYVDDEEEKRKTRELELKRKQRVLGKPVEGDEECVEWEYDIMDPELRRINEEGRRVGWAYRYRIRRKLDKLKQQQAEQGIAFDLEKLTNELDKKEAPTPTTTKAVPTEAEAEVNKKSVGWKYRYRVSKMLEAQKREAEMAKLKSQHEEEIPLHERLDPELARLTPEERAVGWQYRYRIRRKLDAIKNATRESHAGKHRRKHKQQKEEIIKKVEESIEKILNIDDIDETPFMEYFRRTSSYVLFGLLPTGRKSICLLPLPVRFSFCDENAANENTLTTTKATMTTMTTAATKMTPAAATDSTKSASTKTVRTKKEKRSQKQSVPSRSIKSDPTFENTVDEVKPVTKTPVKTFDKPQRKQTRQRSPSSTRYQNDEQVRHYDEEEEPVKKVVGVESQNKKNKKRFQIIGKEVKAKPQKPSTTTTTTTLPPVTTTTTSIPQTTRKNSPTAEPSEPKVTRTTTSPPLRSISEIIQEEASTFVSTKATSPEEAAEEIDEANDDLQVTTTMPPTATPNLDTKDTPNDDDDDDDDGSSSTDTDSDSDSESTSTEDPNENADEADLSPMKKIKKIYENAKESVHGVFDLPDENHSS